MNDHWNAGFVTSMCTNIADSSSTTALATQRPGCRTGIAVTSAPVRAGAFVVPVIAGLRYCAADGLTCGLAIAPNPTCQESRTFL